jgi:decaprenyl-phosphate phosphoribosyltransferase
VAFAAFCLASGGAYALNDALDAPRDRLHPEKRLRPVASGRVSRGEAFLLAGGLFASALGAAWAGAGPMLAGVVAAYVMLTAAYSLGLKRVAVADVLVVAAGFVLRLVAGGVAAGIPITGWFFAVASGGALFLAAGKRDGELARFGERASELRVSLGWYGHRSLLVIRLVTAGVTVAAYALWAFQRAGEGAGGFPWFQLSVVPFALGVLRAGLAHDAGGRAVPDDALLRDPPFLALGGACLVLLVGGIYLSG